MFLGVVQNNNTLALSGAVTASGSSGLAKSGAGALILAGSNSYSGGTTISQGNLAVNGSLVGLTSVFSGGILSGTGTVGGVTVNGGGQIAPGNPAGILKLAGNLTLLPGAALDFSLDTLSDSSKIEMSSQTLLLDGQQFADFNFTPLAGFGRGMYTLIDAGNSQGSLGDDLGGTIDDFPAMLVWSGNNLSLNVTPEPSTLALLGAGALAFLVFRRCTFPAACSGCAGGGGLWRRRGRR
ncbi:MAG: autotransporter-associated beta strand repeat-containing protein [Thermoguttaceae bacterium]